MATELSCVARETFDWQEAKTKFEELLAMDRNSPEFIATYWEVDQLIAIGLKEEQGKAE